MTSNSAGHYFRFLDRVHQTLLPRSYLEIGVFKGKSLALALPCTRAVGVDPAAELFFPIGPTGRLCEMTSDEFFANPELAITAYGASLDLAFIDGLHLFEQALRDFINVERICHSGGVVLLHDVYPKDPLAASRNWKSKYWAGDVFKVMLILKDYRPDLVVSVIDVFPTGLGVVTCLNPGNTVLSDKYDEILDRYLSLEWSEGAELLKSSCHIVPDDWRLARSSLPSEPFQRLKLRPQLRKRGLRAPRHLRVIPYEVERRIGLSPIGPALRRTKFRFESRLPRLSRELGTPDMSTPN